MCLLTINVGGARRVAGHACALRGRVERVYIFIVSSMANPAEKSGQTCIIFHVSCMHRFIVLLNGAY